MKRGNAAGDHNQAMMELGATICLPQAPLCLHCPVYCDVQDAGGACDSAACGAEEPAGGVSAESAEARHGDGGAAGAEGRRTRA